jgi:hypothetical protein
VRAKVHAIGMKVLDLRHVFRFEIPAMGDQYLVTRTYELFDDGAADEPRPAEDDDFQRVACSAWGFF